MSVLYVVDSQFYFVRDPAKKFFIRVKDVGSQLGYKRTICTVKKFLRKRYETKLFFDFRISYPKVPKNCIFLEYDGIMEAIDHAYGKEETKTKLKKYLNSKLKELKELPANNRIIRILVSNANGVKEIPYRPAATVTVKQQVVPTLQKSENGQNVVMDEKKIQKFKVQKFVSNNGTFLKLESSDGKIKKIVPDNSQVQKPTMENEQLQKVKMDNNALTFDLSTGKSPCFVVRDGKIEKILIKTGATDNGAGPSVINLSNEQESPMDLSVKEKVASGKPSKQDLLRIIKELNKRHVTVKELH